MADRPKLLVSEADPRAATEVARVLAALAEVVRSPGSSAELGRTLAGRCVDAVLLGADASTLLERIQVVRAARPDARVVVFAPGVGVEDRALSAEAVREGASVVPLAADALAGGTLDERYARALKLRLSVLLKERTCTEAPVKRNRTSGYELVFIASSTGGPQALATLLGGLDASIQQPVLVVQHMPAGFVRGLADRLDRTCRLPVHVAEDGETIEGGRVYLAAGGRHLKVARHDGRLVARYDDGPPVHSCKPAADVMIESGVRAAGGPHVVVVLTGMGADGSRGCEAVKRAGGRVLAQDQESSTVWGMPGAVVEAGLANEVGPPESLARHLSKLLGGGAPAAQRRPSKVPSPAPHRAAPAPTPEPARARTPMAGGIRPGAACRGETMSPEDFEFVRRFVREHAAIDIEDGKEYLVLIRLEPLARKAGLGSIPALVQELRRSASSGLATSVIEAMTTNETMFFRDGTPFRILRETLLPQLAASPTQGRKLRIWCAASSTGQEPYSIAMTLRESLPDVDSWDVQIRASDISDRVLEQARKGVYNQLEVSRGLPAKALVAHFVKKGLTWEVKPEIKRMVRFERLNLIERWPAFEPLDFLFIRNVLIYFDVPTKQRILERARALLRPGGVLFLGSAESTIGLVDGFDRRGLDGGGAYRRVA